MLLNKHNFRTAIGASAAMLVLILDGKTALAGASEGIGICLNILIPSLFPFFLLSILLTGALRGQDIPVLRPVAKLCRIPKGAESLLAIGILGGYPVGAQNVALAYQTGLLSNMQAARMITFCNNAGPAFIFGVLGCMFSSKAVPWLLWIIHIAGALFSGILLPGGQDCKTALPPCSNMRLPDALAKAVRTTGLVCGWVIIMRMTLSFLQRWFLWLLPMPLQVAASALLELAGGCMQLEYIQNEGLRFILASAFLSLGGVCITLQTASVTEGISMHLYFPGKMLQCAVSVLLSCIAQFLFPVASRCSCGPIAAVFMVILGGSVLSLHYSKNNSGNPAAIGV